jgi:hypothetical protein
MESRNSIEEASKLSKDLIKNLEIFHNKIFGEEGVLEGGLKKELETRNAELDEFKEKQKEKHATLFKEIEGLLPGATSAGLATAYNDLKKSFDKPIKINAMIFYGALFGMVITAFVLITDKVGFWFIDFAEVSWISREKRLQV